MSILEDKANQVAVNARGENPTVVVDTATIIAIIGIITQLVKLYRDCKKTPSEAKMAMASPNFFQRRRLRKIARQSLAEHQSEEHIGAVVSGVLSQGKTVTVEEVAQLYAEVVQ